MSAQIIPFPQLRHPRAVEAHEQHVIDAALRVERLALRIHAEYDDRSRITALERGVQLLPGGRQEMRDFMSVFGADPYMLAINGRHEVSLGRPA